ncbi:MAG: hypothetical protein ACK53L_12870, partial [Pirellulaceae bacterium]
IKLQLLLGMRDGVEGRFDLKPPASWSDRYRLLAADGGDVAKVALQLAQQFGDTLAAETMLATLRNRQAPLEERRQAIQALAGRKRLELQAELLGLCDDPDLRREAIRAVAAFDDPRLAEELIRRYPKLNTEERLE